VFSTRPDESVSASQAKRQRWQHSENIFTQLKNFVSRLEALGRSDYACCDKYSVHVLMHEVDKVIGYDKERKRHHERNKIPEICQNTLRESFMFLEAFHFIAFFS
jgi:hypothetical protein